MEGPGKLTSNVISKGGVVVLRICDIGSSASITVLALMSLTIPTAALAQDSGAQPATAPSTAAQSTRTEAQLEEIVVTGQRATLSKAADLKKEAPQVIESILASDIGKMPDQTVAAALQRVPGIQVTIADNNEVTSPLIRGLGDITTTLSGREIFTGVGRGFNFQDLPAEALAGVDVYKSNTANLIEGGVAGVIDMKLQKPFNFKEGSTLVSNVRGTYSPNSDKVNYTLGLLGSHRVDTSMGEFGLLLDGSYAKQHFNRPISFNCDPRANIINDDGSRTGPVGADDTVLPNCAGGLTQSGSYERPQFNAAFQWDINSHWHIYADALYAGYKAKYATYFIFSDLWGAESVTNNNKSSNCYDTGVGTDGYAGDQVRNVCLSESATFNNVDGLTSTQAKDDSSDTYVWGGGTRYESAALYANLDISYVKSKTKNRTLIIDIGKEVSSVDVVVDDGGNGTIDMAGNPLGSADDYRLANGFYQYYSQADSTLFAAKLDGGYRFDGPLQEIQFGSRYANRKADFRAVEANPAAPGGHLNTLVSSANLGSDFLVESPYTIDYINNGQHWLTPSADYIRDNQDALRELYGQAPGQPDWDDSRSYYAAEKTYAGYLQGKYEFPLGGGMVVDGLFGARLTRTDRIIDGTGRVSGVDTPVTRDTSDSDLLPNASARIRFEGGLQARLTYAKTLSRPTFSDLNPGLFYDVPANTNIRPNGRGGNPDLKPQKSNSIDATLEYYFGTGNYVSLAVYHRKLKDRIVSQEAEEIIDGITYLITRPRNLGAATLKGLEIGGQYFFDFLPEGLDGLGGFGNFTLSDSEVTVEGDSLSGSELLGVSKYSYNIGALYEKYGVTGRMVYTWRSTYNEYELCCVALEGDEAQFNKVKASGRLDFSLAYDITPQVTVSVDGVNILRAQYRSYFNTTDFPHDVRDDDSSWGMTLRTKF